MKTCKSLFLSSFLIGLVFGVMTCIDVVPTYASACLRIDADLVYGTTDKVSGGPISSIQAYLQSSGYLKVAPNGHFGKATLSAVKKFQTNNGISASGRVGPLTRAAISQKTCASITSSAPSAPSAGTQNQSTVSIISNDYNVGIPTSTTPIITPVATPPISTTISSIDVTSPSVGQVLSTGSSTVIRWNKQPANTFNIILEQPGGIGAGFITRNLSASNPLQYIWKVGSIFSSQTNTDKNADVGTYRIRLESSTGGVAPTDEVSGWFTLVAPQFAVRSVVPSSAPADNATSIVLFGSGLTSGTSIYFDSNFSGTRMNNAYVSTDGSVLVFTIPMTVSAGSHTLFINNGADTSVVTLPFTVTIPQ